jgi:hypothetical protein
VPQLLREGGLLPQDVGLLASMEGPDVRWESVRMRQSNESIMLPQNVDRLAGMWKGRDERWGVNAMEVREAAMEGESIMECRDARRERLGGDGVRLAILVVFWNTKLEGVVYIQFDSFEKKEYIPRFFEKKKKILPQTLEINWKFFEKKIRTGCI